MRCHNVNLTYRNDISVDETVESIDVLLRLVDEAWKVRALSAELELSLVRLRLEETSEKNKALYGVQKSLVARIKILEEKFSQTREGYLWGPEGTAIDLEKKHYFKLLQKNRIVGDWTT